MPENVTNGSRHPRLFIPGTEDDPLKTREDDRTRAHRARLERDVKSAVVKPPAVQHGARLANRNQLRVRRRILIAHSSIVRSRNDGTRPNHDGTDGNLVLPRAIMANCNRVAHELFIHGAPPLERARYVQLVRQSSLLSGRTRLATAWCGTFMIGLARWRNTVRSRHVRE